MNPNREPFVGTWELDPESPDYRHGRPGRRATYTVEAVPAGLMFTLDGEDADRKPMKFTTAVSWMEEISPCPVAMPYLF